MSHLYTTGKGQRVATSRNVQYRKALGFRFGAANDVCQQPGHIVHVDKLCPSCKLKSEQIERRVSKHPTAQRPALTQCKLTVSSS